MKQQRVESATESQESIGIDFPPIEAFLRPSQIESTWLKKFATDSNFVKQLEARKTLSDKLDAVIARLPRPDISLQDAITEEYISEQQVADFYTWLAALLDNSPDYRRIVLYLPFEFLPRASWKPTSPELQEAALKFKTAYLGSWKSLLHTHDVRANFVDGDVLEVASRVDDLPRVVKAAHLIPELIEFGLVGYNEMKQLIQETDDEVLRQSIAEAFSDASSLPIETTTKVQITERRKQWLTQEAQRKAFESAGDMVRDTILRGETSEATTSPTLLVNGIRKAVAATAQKNLKRSRAVYTQYREQLSSLWQEKDSNLHNELSTAFYHFRALGVVDDRALRTFGLMAPHLAVPFSENLHGMQKEIADVNAVATAIEQHKELSRFIYPVILVYGSRLKGYGSPASDVDIAVFVEPETKLADKERLRELLRSTLAQHNISGDAIEFWLEKTPDGLCVRDVPEIDARIGDSSWSYVLFGAAWEGDDKIVNKLREQLLPSYLHDDGKMLYGRDARKVYIEELERDTLLYRLLHRGYAKFYPTSTADTFLDPGYRRLATQLFVRRVFLPKLSRE